MWIAKVVWVAFMILLTEAMGLEHDNRYKKYQMAGGVDQIMWEARDHIADSGYPVERIKQAVQWKWDHPDKLRAESLAPHEPPAHAAWSE